MADQMRDNFEPMQDVRVVNLGTGWAARVSSMLLADQGANVIEIVKPDRSKSPIDVFLDRGKDLLELDLKDSGAAARARDIAMTADVVMENMRPGAVSDLSLDYASLARPDVIYISQPGFAAGDPNRNIPAWDGAINASVGVFTNLSPLGPLLGGEPVYSSIPMASAYGGVLGALSASLGLFNRQRSGEGQYIEVPLADAVMSAMALLIADIEGQPSRYNFPSIDNAVLQQIFPVLRDLRGHMNDEHVAQIASYVRGHGSPGLQNYECADGRHIFVCAIDHVLQTRRFLDAVGVLDQAISEGMVLESPYSSSADAGNNILQAAKLKPAWRARLISLIGAAIKKRPSHEWETLLRTANVPVTLVQTSAEWLADPVHFASGVTTDLSDKTFGVVRQPGRFITIESDSIRSPQLAPRRDAGHDGFVFKHQSSAPSQSSQKATGGGMLDGLKVLDFSNIIAGPATGRTLAEHGADVIRIDPPAAPAGPFTTMWFGIDVNQGKRALVLDLKTEEGRAALAPLIRNADIVLHNFLDRSARSIGIAHDQLTAINPDIISCQVSGWAGPDGGEYKDDPTFDPVVQSATGITARYGSLEQPTLHGIASCVDYLTGFTAATGIVQALIAREAGRGGSHVRTSLAMAGQLVQFPHMVATENAGPGDEPSGQMARGAGPDQHLYELIDGWAYLGCRPGDVSKVAVAVDAQASTVETLARRLREMSLADVQSCLANVPGAGVLPVRSLAEIRNERTANDDDASSNWMNVGSFRLRRTMHPSGFMTTLPLPTWIRPRNAFVKSLQPAVSPGKDTVAVLKEIGLSEDTIEVLLRDNVARDSWIIAPAYLPE